MCRYLPGVWPKWKGELKGKGGDNSIPRWIEPTAGVRPDSAEALRACLRPTVRLLLQLPAAALRPDRLSPVRLLVRCCW